MEKQFIQIQIALFFKSDFSGPFESVSLKIKELFGNDLNSQIIGIPNDAPAEIPRVTINSPLVNINFAKNRIDFFSNNQNFFTENADKIFDLLNIFSISVGRVGFVQTFFVDISNEKFKSIFNQEKIFVKNPKEINVKFNEIVNINSVNINNSQAYSTGFIKTGAVQNNGFILIKDTNTLQEDLIGNDFNIENTVPLYKKAIDLPDQVII